MRRQNKRWLIRASELDIMANETARPSAGARRNSSRLGQDRERQSAVINTSNKEK